VAKLGRRTARTGSDNHDHLIDPDHLLHIVMIRR